MSQSRDTIDRICALLEEQQQIITTLLKELSIYTQKSPEALAEEPVHSILNERRSWQERRVGKPDRRQRLLFSTMYKPDAPGQGRRENPYAGRRLGRERRKP